MVEFAIVTAAFMLLVLGIIEFGLIAWQKSIVTGAAREGTRFAIVRGTQSGRTTDANQVADSVRARTALSPIVVTTTWPTTKDPGQTVIVKVDYTHRLGAGLLSAVFADSIVLSSTSRMVITF